MCCFHFPKIDPHSSAAAGIQPLDAVIMAGRRAGECGGGGGGGVALYDDCCMTYVHQQQH